MHARARWGEWNQIKCSVIHLHCQENEDLNNKIGFTSWNVFSSSIFPFIQPPSITSSLCPISISVSQSRRPLWGSRHAHTHISCNSLHTSHACWTDSTVAVHCLDSALNPMQTQHRVKHLHRAAFKWCGQIVRRFNNSASRRNDYLHPLHLSGLCFLSQGPSVRFLWPNQQELRCS